MRFPATPAGEVCVPAVFYRLTCEQTAMQYQEYQVCSRVSIAHHHRNLHRKAIMMCTNDPPLTSSLPEQKCRRVKLQKLPMANMLTKY